MNALEEIIREEIRAKGAMRFYHYMELALYHPDHGYYSGKRRIGREGDFFTNVSVGSLFGRLLARQAAQMWQLLDEPSSFWIIEQGAHDGQLAIDILEGIRADHGEFFRAVRYAFVEPAFEARKIQESRLIAAGFGQSVEWVSKLSEWKGDQPTGLFLSNELVDAFPVHLIRHEAQAWKERHVGLDRDDNALTWEDRPLRDPELQLAVDDLQIPTLEGYTTEINLAARSWMAGIANFLTRGYVLTIDYGFPASLYYAPFRMAGTLTTYRQHHRDDTVLLAPGERDMTAHVDFTALARAGESGGLIPLGLVDQQRFLMGVAHAELVGNIAYSSGIRQNLRAWNTLTHPGHLGSRFQVLLQSKHAPDALDGLRHARGGLD